MPRKATQPTGPQAVVKPVRHHTGPLTSANIAGYECFTTGTPAQPLTGQRWTGPLYHTLTEAEADMRDLGCVPVPTFKQTRALVRF